MAVVTIDVTPVGSCEAQTQKMGWATWDQVKTHLSISGPTLAKAKTCLDIQGLPTQSKVDLLKLAVRWAQAHQTHGKNYTYHRFASLYLKDQQQLLLELKHAGISVISIPVVDG